MALKPPVGDIPDTWPPLWFPAFRKAINPTRVNYAGTYAIVSFSTEERLQEAQAILMLFGKTGHRCIPGIGEAGLALQIKY